MLLLVFYPVGVLRCRPNGNRSGKGGKKRDLGGKMGFWEGKNGFGEFKREKGIEGKMEGKGIQRKKGSQEEEGNSGN